MSTLLLAVSACGQMYAKPGANQQSAAPTAPGQGGGPPGANDPEPDVAALGNEPSQSGAPESTTPPPPPVTPGIGGDAKAWVDAHNRVRAKHCAPPVTWSPRAAQAAQAWANALRDQGCKFGHSPNNKFGENLAAGTIGSLDPSSTVDYWYSEIKDYKFPNGGFSMDTGHFTQVIWKGTTSVGCARAQCQGNDIFVCEYDPPGNWDGEYPKNVVPAGCK